MIPLPTRLLTAAAMFLLLSAAPLAWGQLAPGMDGRALDANSRLGGGGINTPMQHNLFNVGNLYVTGNVTAGRSFRGFSPIRDSTSLFLSLPTAGLSTFQRDSTGLNNVIISRAPGLTNPFFNPATTVTNAGAIGAGQNLPGTSVPRSTFVIPYGFSGSRQDTDPLDITLGVRPVDSAVPNSSMYTPNNLSLLQDLKGYDRLRLAAETEALRQSPIFGQSISRTRSVLPTDARGGLTLEDPYALPTGLTLQRSADPFKRQPHVFTDSPATPTSEEMLATSRELLSPTAIAPKLFDRQLSEAPRDQLTGRPLPPPPTYLATSEDRARDPVAARDRAAQLAPSMTPPSQALGEHIAYDTEALGIGLPAGPTEAHPLLELSRAVRWLAKVEEDAELREQIFAVRGLREQYEYAVSIVQSASSEPIGTLAAGTQSKIDQLIARAEETVREGNYYQASTIYGLAAAIDPGNPLIRLGHAHALLAAGEYLTAVLHLTTAIEMYPAFAYLNLDLNELIPDPNALDIRRADLERRLELGEDYKLRFLLGYIEYYSGLKKFGLPDLRKAAQAAPEGSVIARFPTILQSGQKPGDHQQEQADMP